VLVKQTGKYFDAWTRTYVDFGNSCLWLIDRVTCMAGHRKIAGRRIAGKLFVRLSQTYRLLSEQELRDSGHRRRNFLKGGFVEKWWRSRIFFFFADDAE
jgi:hypothetical protein